MNNTTYNDITKIIFKRYPRIKGAYCASIAYGVIEYFESKMPAAAPATASGDASRTAIKHLITAYASTDGADHAVIDAALAVLGPVPATASGDELLAKPLNEKASETELARAWMISHGYGNNTIVGALADLHGRIQRMTTIPTEAPSTEQEWAKVDPAVAFHLIERHAEDWADAGRMMEAWRAAVSAATKPTADLSKVPVVAYTKVVHQGWPEYNRTNEFSDGSSDGAALVKLADVQSLLAIKPAAAPAAPEGFVLMPKRLTAENGAKSLFMGEFKETLHLGCPDCEPDGESCETCGDAGEIEHSVAIGWDTIKEIYALAVEKLAAAPAASTPAAEQDAGYTVLSERRIAQIGWALRMQAFENAKFREEQGSKMTGPEQDEFNQQVNFARAIEAEFASRCRAQGGDTNNISSGNSAASTTGSAQTAGQVRDQDHVRNLIEYAEDAVRDMRMWMENYGQDDETNDLIANIEETLSALRPTPTHSSEAGDA